VDIVPWLLMIGALALAVASTWTARDRRQARIERRIGMLERKLDSVLDHLGIAPTEAGLAEVESFVREGKKIHAIKAYRETTGACLQEAKDAVERIAGGR
jgi:ribosomal protein L7/L12